MFFSITSIIEIDSRFRPQPSELRAATRTELPQQQWGTFLRSPPPARQPQPGRRLPPAASVWHPPGLPVCRQ